MSRPHRRRFAATIAVRCPHASVQPRLHKRSGSRRAFDPPHRVHGRSHGYDRRFTYIGVLYIRLHMSANRNSVEGQVITGITKLSQFLRTAQWRSGSETGLTHSDAVAARACRERADADRRLAEAIGVAQPTATDAFEALRRKELVEKKSDLRDGAPSPRQLPEMDIRSLGAPTTGRTA